MVALRVKVLCAGDFCLTLNLENTKVPTYCKNFRTLLKFGYIINTVKYIIIKIIVVTLKLHILNYLSSLI